MFLDDYELTPFELSVDNVLAVVNIEHLFIVHLSTVVIIVNNFLFKSYISII